MSKLLWFICIALIGTGLFALLVYLRRTQKAKQLELQQENWETNCGQVDPQETIFVLLCVSRRRGGTAHRAAAAALPAVNSLFERAYCPQRIVVGVATAPGALDAVSGLFPQGASQREEFPHASRFVHQVRVCGEVTLDGPSPTRARALASLYDRERFVLVTGSRATFAPGWDRVLCAAHGGRPRTVITSRAASESAASFTCVVDVDSDGMPLLGARAFARPPIHARSTLFASSQELFGLGAEIVPLVGDTGLGAVRGDLDALVLTLVLRMNRFSLEAPTDATIYIPPRSDETAQDSASVRARLALHSVQAILCVLSTQSLFRRLLADKEDRPAAGVLASLHAATLLPWIRPALGASFLIPAFLEASRFVQEHAAPEAAVRARFTELARLSVERAQGLAEAPLDEALAAAERASVLVKQHRRSLFPGTVAWEEVVTCMVAVNREVVLRFMRMPGDVKEVLEEELGINPQKGSMAGRSVLGLLPPGTPDDQEVKERFGTRAAFQRERARWRLE